MTGTRRWFWSFHREMFSVIGCSHRPERAKFIEAHYSDVFRDGKHEFILIDDAKSLCEGFERGFQQSRGELVIFSHDDIEFVSQNVPSTLQRHLKTWDMVGIAGTTRLIDGRWWSSGDPYSHVLVCYPMADGSFSVRCAGRGDACVAGIQALDGCFIACRRQVVESVGFDKATFDGFHLYDLDFTFRAHLLGFRLAVCRDIALIHASLGEMGATWQFYRERFESKLRGRLEAGSPSKLTTASFRIEREQLGQFCQWENLEQRLPW
jgi:GT2 family glycosyltransferase